MSKVHVAMARRSTPDALRVFAEKEAYGVFTSELARCEDQWRGGLAGVKHRLAELEATCDAMISAAPAAPAYAVSELIDKIVAAATADADAMAQKIEAQAQARAAEAQALVDRLQTEVRAGQEQLQSAREQLQQEHEARARAESASKDAQVAREQAISAFETQLRKQNAELQANLAQISALKQQLEVGQAERAKLMATFEAVQSAVRRAVSTFEPAEGAQAPQSAAAPRDDDRREATPASRPWPPIASSGQVESPTAAKSDQPDARLRIVELSANAHHANIGDYVTTLLETAEEMYWQDINLALPASEVIERLTANLRHASHLFTARLRADPAGDGSVFMNQVSRLLDTKAATSFGRHLSIAAYETERQESLTAAVPHHVDNAR